MKLAVQLYSLREYVQKNGIEKALQLVAECGYDGVEFAGFYGKTPAEMKALVARYGLEPVSAHMGAADVKNNLPYIDELGIRYVFVAWASTEEFSDAEKYALLLKNMREGKQLLAPRGVIFGYHNHEHEFANGADHMRRLVEDADVYAETDVCWLFVGGKDPVSYMKGMGKRLAAVHIKEVPSGDAHTDAAPVVGEGLIDLAAIMAQARDQGVEWGILEAEKTAVPEKEYLQKSLENIRNALKG